MPDVFNELGLQTKTLTELITELEDNYKSIYGTDINLDPNSPDGQLLNIQAQTGIDLRELLTKINAGFDRDQAEGRVLDQRLALIGIKRNGGTFTLAPVEITTDRAVNLVGLDAAADDLTPDIDNLYTVKDDSGNLFYLLTSQNIISAGTNTFSFRAAEIGDVQVSVGTITTPVTITAGVTGINNTAGASSQGQDEETDAEFRRRGEISTAITSIGYLDAIQVAISNITGVVIANVLENVTDVTDGNGIPPHSIWCIVEGGDSDEIGEVIYAKKSSGSGMKGSVTVNVPRPSGATFEAKFDRPVDADLYIRFSLSLTGGTFDPDEIKRLIVENITWQVGADAVGSTITTYIQTLNANYQITGMQVSDDGAAWAEVVSVASTINRFVNDTARITIT